MADTLGHVLEEAGSDSGALVWAHNSQISDARATDMGMVRGKHNLGQLARERRGSDVALIGLGTHHEFPLHGAPKAPFVARGLRKISPAR